MKHSVSKQNKTNVKVHGNTKYTPEIRAKLLEQLEQYVEENEYPMIHKFCVDHNIPTTTLYEWEEFSVIRENARDKKRVFLENALLNEKGNPTKYIYLLKAIHRLYDTPQPTQTPQDSLSVTLSVPQGQLVDAMGKFLQKNKQVNTEKPQ